MPTKRAESAMKSRKKSGRVKIELMLPPEIKDEFNKLSNVTMLTKVALFSEMLKRWHTSPISIEQEEEPTLDSVVDVDARRLLFEYGANPEIARRALQQEIDTEFGAQESWKVVGSEAGTRYDRINKSLILIGRELGREDDFPDFLRVGKRGEKRKS